MTAKGILPLPSDNPPVEAAAVPEQWKPLFRELTTYYRQLPELLKEGNAGRHVVILADKVYGVWDTVRDALQHGGGLPWR